MHQVGNYFQLEQRKSCFTQEFRAGTVTFLTVRTQTHLQAFGMPPA